MNATLTPELVLMAISQGMLDENLNEVMDAARARREIVSTRKAINLDSGDEFLITNILPKYLSGERVRLVRHDDGWLVCEFLGYPGGRYTKGNTVKLRHTHVGTIVHRVSGTEA